MRALITLALLAAFPAAGAAADNPPGPPTAAVAKKCRESAVKAHPPVLAGSKTGAAAAERDYFLACIKRGGKAEE